MYQPINQYPEECYLHEDKKTGEKITRTLNNLNSTALDLMKRLEEIKAVEGTTSVVIGGYEVVIFYLHCALIFGFADAAAPLAYLCYNGFGDKQNIDKVKLYIAIGKNLDSEICKQYIEFQNNEIFDLSEFLQTKPKYSRDILSKAERFSNICKTNAKDVTNDTILESMRVANALLIFDKANLDDVFKIHLTLRDKIEHLGHKGTLKYIGKSVIEKVSDFGEKIHEFIDTGNNKNVSTNVNISKMAPATTTTTTYPNYHKPYKTTENVSTNVNTSKVTNAVTTTTTTYSNNHKPYKTTEIRNEHNKCYGEIHEETIKTNITFRLNNCYKITIIEYRSISLPDKIIPGWSFDFKFVLSGPNGDKMEAKDNAYLGINYNLEGKICKLTVPNPPVVSQNHLWPALVMYHGQIYTLPVNSGHYNHLVQKVYEHSGMVIIGHEDPPYSLELIG